MKAFDLPVAFASYHVTPVVKLKDYGECDFDLRQIVVRRAEHLDAMRFVIWHEYFHALMHELGYKNLRDDEAFMEGLALSIMRVRVEQPWL